MSHILNLLSNDFQKRLTGIARSAFSATMESLHTLWAITRTSSKAKSICKEVLGEILKYPCATRWNSTTDCIVQCNRSHIRNKLNTLIEKLQKELDSISSRQLKLLHNNDFQVMSAYEKVLEPVARALDTLQGEKNNSQGYIVPVLHSLKIRISGIEPTNNILKDFKSTMVTLINGNRLTKYFEFNTTNKDFLLASVTLPRFKLNFIVDEENKLFVKNLLIMECKKNCEEEIIQPVCAEMTENPTPNDDFLISFSNPNVNRRNSMDNLIETEVVQYLNDDRVDVKILNDYRFVRKVYYKFNTSLSSSAAVERVFSQSAMIFTPRRNRISNDNFEKTLFLKLNRIKLEKI